MNAGCLQQCLTKTRSKLRQLLAKQRHIPQTDSTWYLLQDEIDEARSEINRLERQLQASIGRAEKEIADA